MLGGLLKVVAAVATTAVAIPYTTALLCNLTYGWPQIRNKFRRAFSPKKVFALNFVLIQKLVIHLKYAPLYLQWKAYYKMATANEIMKDRTYGRNDQTLDLHFPQGKGSGDEGPRPVVVFVYGGAWGSGDKDMYGLLCSAIANRLNVIVCCPNHSTYPQGYVDDMIQDIVDCVMWLHQNVEHYNGDKNKLILLGHSSGAHLCAMSVLELLHDELMASSTEDLQPVTTSSIHFSEKHFAAKSDSENNDDRHSTTSSGSFCVLDKNNSNGSQGEQSDGHQSDGQQGNAGLGVSQFEMLATQKSETEMSEASLMESDIKELTQAEGSGLRYRGSGAQKDDDTDMGKVEEKTEGPAPVSAGAEEEEDSGDNDSVVTVKQQEGDAHPTLLQLGKTIKAVIGLAGVYHIGDHFLHESKRGVEDISTMARSMYGQQHFDRFSPTHILRGLTTPLRLPKILLLHGTEDYVVPISSTTKISDELVRLNSDVTVRILPGCDHYEICLDLMKPSRKFHGSVMALIEDTAASAFS